MLPRLLKVGYPGSINPYGFLLALLFGMFFAQHNVFVRFATYQPMRNKTIWRVICFLFWGALLVGIYLLCSRTERYQAWELHYAIAPVIAIIFCKQYIIRIPVVDQILQFFGKHALNIFLVHTFIRYTFFQDFTYSFKHFALICLVLFGISLGISIVIEGLKKLLHFDRFTRFLCQKAQSAVEKI